MLFPDLWRWCEQRNTQQSCLQVKKYYLVYDFMYTVHIIFFHTFNSSCMQEAVQRVIGTLTRALHGKTQLS